MSIDWRRDGVYVVCNGCGNEVLWSNQWFIEVMELPHPWVSIFSVGETTHWCNEGKCKEFVDYHDKKVDEFHRRIGKKKETDHGNKTSGE